MLHLSFRKITRIYLNNKNLSKSYIKRNEPNYVILILISKNRLIEYGWKEIKFYLQLHK